jgi:addiction module RelB/DinJ family antitoxin
MDAMITARVPIETKRQANRVFDSLGTTPSKVINDLFEYVATSKSLPEFHSKEQILFSGQKRDLDSQSLTPKMKLILKAMKAIESKPPIEWGDDSDKSFEDLLVMSRKEHYQTFLGH